MWPEDPTEPSSDPEDKRMGSKFLAYTSGLETWPSLHSRIEKSLRLVLRWRGIGIVHHASQSLPRT
jgi:hypothetical protein